EHFPFWQAFFESLGFQVVNSDVSNHDIIEDALKLFIAETCYPIKIVYGHVANLLQKDVDYVFLPSLIRITEETEELGKGAYVCPWVQSVGSSIRTCFDFEKFGAKLITSPVSFSYDVADVKRKLKQLARDFDLSDRELGKATECGLRAYKSYKSALYTEGDNILKELQPDEKVMVVISRPYNGYDPKLSLELPKKLRNLGFKAIPMDFLRLEDGENDFAYMYWRYGQRILSAAEYIRRHPNLFAVYLTSFACGPDSFITHFFRREMSGKPYVQLELDEHSADAGLITRCEAFADSLRFYKFQPPVTSFNIACKDFHPFEKSIYIPYMCDHAYALRAAMQRFGLNAEVLDEPDDLTLDYGKKFTSGKECFPLIVTTGDMIKKIHSDGFDAEKTVFFMPGAGGPCRFGLYSEYQRIVLYELGYGDIPVFSPHSNNGYADFGLEETSFRKVAWRGLVFIDCLNKLLHSVRPYELNRGETEKLYFSLLARMDSAIVHDESLEQLAKEAAIAFTKVPVSGEKYPLVGVVGEIYLRNNRFSNNFLIDKLEKLGLEVRLATFCEWPMYSSADFRRDSLINHNWKDWLKANLQMYMQNRHEHKIINAFENHINLGHEYSVEEVLDLSSKYLTRDVKGEALLTIGKAIEMANEGTAGIVNAMPFNCMPGTIVSSLSRKISQDLGTIPWLNISYEGLRDSGEDTRLEAFAEQVKVFAHSGTALSRGVIT
ncbi:MAG: acyl-CoA dehydratase activase-related protein, partial [candidate division Zixibacteria bacterium]|nr:acyl-CoA dehydratase activase-related protein [candidate division Zixibacteria bacterium]